MAGKLSVRLTGDLDISVDSATCPGGFTSVGTGFKLGITDFTRCADTEISQNLYDVDASGAPVVLPFPPNLEGRLLYLQVIRGGPLGVQVDFAAQGPTLIPVKGLLVIEPADLDFIAGITILTGQGTIEWAVTGSEA